jgi:hypothetical protein
MHRIQHTSLSIYRVERESQRERERDEDDDDSARNKAEPEDDLVVVSKTETHLVVYTPIPAA